MLNKDERTIAVYMKAGALMRLYKTIGAKLFDAVGMVISAADRKKLLCALHGIDAVCSNAENNMFRDHPDLSSSIRMCFTVRRNWSRGAVWTKRCSL